MKATCWMGRNSVEVEDVPDPTILDGRDAILKITSTAICGSDLHLLDGFIPALKPGDILGHEFMGEVVETGKDVTNLKKGDRVAVPFNIACGGCWHCRRTEFSLCETSNPNHRALAEAFGYPTAALFGYTHLYGGIAGGQAEYVRVPFADVGAMHVPDGLPDEQVLFLTDIFPTGWMAAENAAIEPGDEVAVWGCGPVGQFTIVSAFLLGAGRVIAIDRIPERLAMAQGRGAEVINYEENDDLVETLKELTGGRGPDACIDAVGAEAHGTGPGGVYDKVKAMAGMETDRPTALRQVIQACRPGGRVSIPGVYGGAVDKFPIGPAFGKALTFRMGQTHTHRYMRPLLERVQKGEVDPSFVITHRLPLERATEAYKTFRDKQDGCIKVVLKPGA